MPRIEAPQNGVKIRMYRQGHGDCFLLTMRRDDGKPFNLLIDCGFKPGSEIKVPIEAVIDDIHEATGGHLDVLMVTHEHQDHVNMFLAKLNGKTMFDAFTVDGLWFGWTANRKDKRASEIREGHKKAAQALADVSARLRASFGAAGVANEIDEMLEFEGFGAAGHPPGKIDSKATIPTPKIAAAMDYVFDKVDKEAKRKYFKPHEKPFEIEDVPGIRVYALGPPRGQTLLDKELPDKEDADRLYERPGHGLSFGFGSGLTGLFGAVESHAAPELDHFRPFTRKDELTRASGTWEDTAAFFNYFYPEDEKKTRQERWRRVDSDWLFAAAWFARKLNVEVNNSSLVIAIELTGTGKVLLFPGDAQYGNWVSWTEKPFPLGGDSELTVKDLLARTVFYKVGHHGSHNATLKGTTDSTYANLDWLGREFEREFTAVIPANEPWAFGLKVPWEHPLSSIRKALDRKADGRVFQSNIDFSDMKRTSGSPAADWQKFVKQAQGSSGQNLYFDYWVPDE